MNQDILDAEKKVFSLSKEPNSKNTLPGPVSGKGVTPPVPREPLAFYMAEVQKFDLLSQEEEKELAIRFLEEGDEHAAYRLITSNLRLVVKIAMDYQRYWMKSLMDLIQEGNIGLMKAVQKFDPYKGYKLSYYASFWIKAYIIKFIMDNIKLVKIGTTQAQRKLFFNLKKEQEKLAREGIAPEPRLIAKSLDVKESEVIEMQQRLGSWELSLDSPVTDDSRESYGAIMPDEDTSTPEELVADAQLRERLTEVLDELKKGLKEKELTIFNERIMAENPLTLQEIGDRYGISRERIRQIESRLKKKIKAFLTEKLDDVDGYLDALSHD